MPRRCSSSSTGSPSHEFVGSGRGHARPFPKWGTRSRCQHPLFLLERGLQWFSGPPGFGYRVCATRSESVCTPVAPPLEPSLCSQLPTPLWWRTRSPALPHPHLRPPLPWHALYVLYYVYASACPVCGMGACGVCVVSGCECSLRVGSVGLPRLVVGCASVPRVGLSLPAHKEGRRSRPIRLVGNGCLLGNSPASPCSRFARPWGTEARPPPP